MLKKLMIALTICAVTCGMLSVFAPAEETPPAEAFCEETVDQKEESEKDEKTEKAEEPEESEKIEESEKAEEPEEPEGPGETEEPEKPEDPEETEEPEEPEEPEETEEPEEPEQSEEPEEPEESEEDPLADAEMLLQTETEADDSVKVTVSTQNLTWDIQRNVVKRVKLVWNTSRHDYDEVEDGKEINYCVTDDETKMITFTNESEFSICWETEYSGSLFSISSASGMLEAGESGSIGVTILTDNLDEYVEGTVDLGSLKLLFVKE